MQAELAGAIRVGKESCAAGLFWQPAPTAAAARREARLLASKVELGADLYCVRRNGTPQFGLGQQARGHRSGMRAIAAVLANALPEPSWLGAFVTDRGWLYVMVRKGAIMPDGDLLFADEDAARARLLEDLPQGDWEAVFAPAGWGIAAARDQRLDSLARPRSDARLQPVRRPSLAPVALALGLMVGGVAGWSVFLHRSAAPVSVPEVPTVAPPPPPPWQGQPRAGDIIRACAASIESSGTVPGYELDAASCGPGGGSAAYRRRGGTLSWVPGAGAANSPDRLMLALPRPKWQGGLSGDQRLWAADAVRRHVWAAAQDYLLDSEVTEAPARPTAASGQAAALPAPREIVISLASRLPPDALAQVLDPIPAFVAEEVSWQAMRWRVKGKAYVR